MNLMAEISMVVEDMPLLYVIEIAMNIDTGIFSGRIGNGASKLRTRIACLMEGRASLFGWTHHRPTINNCSSSLESNSLPSLGSAASRSFSVPYKLQTHSIKLGRPCLASSLTGNTKPSLALGNKWEVLFDLTAQKQLEMMLLVSTWAPLPRAFV